MKIVVTGASGLLGRAVYAQLKEDGHTVLGTALSRANSENGLVKLDLTNFDDLHEFLNKEKPQAIIHTAAERRPDVVERSPEASQILNVDVPSKIATWCKENAKLPLLINISTDYVFDGTSPPYKVDDSPNPLNAYGKSKWEGEKGIIQHGQAGRISNLRVPVLYGKTHTNDESAVNVLLNALIAGKGNDGKPKKMDANAVRYPTSVVDIAKALSQLCTKYGEPKSEDNQSAIPPTLHFSAMEAMTKYDMCLVMARCLRAVGEEAETEQLIPEYEVDPNAATSRPRHCKLDLSLTKEIGINTDCTSFESWWKEYLEEYAKKARQERAKEAAEAEARRAEEEERRRKEEEKRKKKEEEDRIKQEEERRKKEEEEKIKREEEEKRKKEEEEEKERKRVMEEEKIRKEGEERDRKEKEAEQHETKRRQEAEDTDGQHAEKESERISSQTTRQERSNETQVYGERVTTADKERRESAKSNQEMPTTAPEVLRSSSSTGHASLRSPSSPNPSFSSLQARPTPPATSGRSSPSPSVRSIGAASFLTGTTNIPPRNGEISAAVSSVTDANPLGMSDTVKVRESEQEKGTTKNNREMEDGSGFFPQKLVQAGDGVSLGIDHPRSDAVQQQGQSIDSDNYGEPSPREEGKGSLPFSAQAPFVKTGYGEVPFGVDETTSKTAVVQPKKEITTAIHQRQPSSSQDKTSHVASFQIRVGDPQKVGDPVTAHIVYTMRVITDSPYFRSAQFSVLRRYSDFRWLHAALVHNNPGIFVPPVPEKVKIGRFAPDLVEARRHGLEGCVNKIANNPVLQHDEDFKIFMESQNFHADVKARDQIKGPIPTPEQKTYFGWSTSFTGSSYKYHENDEWFDEQKVYLDHLEFQLKNLVRIVSILAQQRKDLAAATSETSHALMMLSGSSLSRSLSTCFAGLGEVERRSFELTDVQADADVREFGSVLYEFERMVGSARKAFATRIDAWQQWQRLEDEAKKVRIKHEKVKKDVQPGSYKMHDGGRLQAVLDELANVESRCLNAKREFDVIGRRCKEEMDRFESDRIRSFHEAAEIWLQGMIERSTEIMSEWEQYAALLERQTNHKIEIE